MTVRDQITRMRPRSDDREHLLFALLGRFPVRGDAIVLLCGEDAKPRCDTAAGLLQRQFAPLIVATGADDLATHSLGATGCYSALLGLGVAHDRIIQESSSTNTYEQAKRCIEMADEFQWGRLLLVASSYHLPRAFLTFVAAIRDAGLDERVRLVPVPTMQASPFEAPEGMRDDRLTLLSLEAAKVIEYGSHVASYREGLAHLARWENEP